MLRNLFVLLISAGTISAGVITLDTSPLQTSGAGPFTLDFQFTDGSGAGDGNNTVTLSDFSFGGGALDTNPSSSIGGVGVTTGPFGVTLTDTSFLNDVQFSLTPGSSLSFDLSATANSDGPTPDTFTFAIFDGSGSEIATTNPNGFNSFAEVDLPSDTAGTTTVLSPSAAGASVTLNTPVETSSSPTPEPATFLPVGILALWLCRRHRAAAR